jgi:predicted MFS family arabinose efflux permease
MGLTEGVSKSYVSKLVPHEISGSAFGVYQTVMGVATLIASSIAGMLWSAISPSAPFYFGASTAILAAILFLGLSRKLRVAQAF